MVSDDMKKHGTTTVGITGSDGVVFAADVRAAMGYFISSKQMPKIHQIDERAAITIAGMAADGQALAKLMKAELALYKMTKGRTAAIDTAATLMSSIMYSSRFYPYYTQALIGGMDEKPHLFSLDPVGGISEEAFASTGSGSPIAYGVLEENYEKGKTVKDLLPLAVRAVATAMKRDIATGDGIEAFLITKTEVKKLGVDETKKLLKEKD